MKGLHSSFLSTYHSLFYLIINLFIYLYIPLFLCINLLHIFSFSVTLHLFIYLFILAYFISFSYLPYFSFYFLLSFFLPFSVNWFLYSSLQAISLLLAFFLASFFRYVLFPFFLFFFPCTWPISRYQNTALTDLHCGLKKRCVHVCMYVGCADCSFTWPSTQVRRVPCDMGQAIGNV